MRSKNGTASATGGTSSRRPAAERKKVESRMRQRASEWVIVA
jgi:hypothetical protein